MKKNYLFRLWGLLLLLIGAVTVSDAASINIPTFSIERNGTTTLELTVNDGGSAMFTYSGFQFDIFLPSGITIESQEIAPSLTSAGFTLQMFNYGGGIYKCMGYSITGSSNSTSLVTLTLKADNTITTGSQTINIQNVVFSAPDGQDIKLENSSSTGESSVPVTSITISNTTLDLYEGSAFTLTASVVPEDATESDITWTSDQPTIATVGSDGKVVAIAEGTANITASCDGMSATCVVTVKKISGTTVTPGDGTDDGDDDETPGGNTENGPCVIGNDIVMRVGQTANINLIIDPVVEFDPNLKWSLANGGDQIVTMTVNADNTLSASFKGLAVGETTYSVAMPENSETILTGKIKVIAQNPVTSIRISPESLELAKNALPVKLSATVTPDNATIPTLNWTSSDTTVATVEADGTVKPVGEGECDITATATDGSEVTGVCHVTVTAPIDDQFEFDFDESVVGGKEGITLYLAETYQFVPKAQDGYVLPDNIIWSSSDDQTVSVTDDGLITALALGEATITASATVNGQTVTATCKVTVIPIPAVSISINGNNIHTLKTTGTLELTAKVLPDDTTFPEVTWQSSAPELATVSNDGLVTALNAGAVTITAFVTKQPEVLATYEIEITERILGDANDNGVVNVADLVTIADYIANRPTYNFSFVNADVTEDNEISIADINATIDIIMADVPTLTQAPRRMKTKENNDVLISDNFSPCEDKPFNIGFRLQNSHAYSAMQATLRIPEGMEVLSVSTGNGADDHDMVYNMNEDGTLTVVLYSVAKTPIVSTEPAFNLMAVAANDCADIEIENIRAADAAANEYLLSYSGGRNGGVSTGINSAYGDNTVVISTADGVDVINANGETINIYAVSGELVQSRRAASSVESFSLNSGIYIVNVNGVSTKVVKH